MNEYFHSEYEAILTECLDEVIEGRRSAAQCLAAYPAYAAQLAPSLRIAENLRGAQVIRPSLGFRKQAASRLQQRIAASKRPAKARAATTTSRRRQRILLPVLAYRLGVALLIVAILAGVTGAAAYASDGAVPGDTLYTIDVAVEQIELTFTMSADKALTLQLQIATERLSEAERLLDSGDTAHAVEALDAYNVTVAKIGISSEQIASQNRASTSGAIEDTLSQHQVRLQALLSEVPEQAVPGIQRAIEASKQGQEQASKDGKDTPPGQDDEQEPAIGTSTDTPGEAGEDLATPTVQPGNGTAGNNSSAGNGNGSANGQGNSNGSGNGQSNGNGTGNNAGGAGGNNGNGQGSGNKDKGTNDSGTPVSNP
jgi:uncharacterized membrane protein YgcG